MRIPDPWASVSRWRDRFPTSAIQGIDLLGDAEFTGARTQASPRGFKVDLADASNDAGASKPRRPPGQSCLTRRQTIVKPVLDLTGRAFEGAPHSRRPRIAWHLRDRRIGSFGSRAPQSWSTRHASSKAGFRAFDPERERTPSYLFFRKDPRSQRINGRDVDARHGASQRHLIQTVTTERTQRQSSWAAIHRIITGPMESPPINV